jgi:hypothetical protein
MGTDLQKDPLSIAGVNPVRNYADQFASLSAGALNAFLVPAFDVSGYREFTLQISGTWVGTLTFQGSLDGIYFYSVLCLPITGGVPVTTATVNGLYTGFLGCKYFRVQMTAYTSGPALGTLRLSTLPLGLDMLVNSMTVVANGSVAHDGADSGNPVKIGGKSRTADAAAVASGDRSDLYMDVLGKIIVVPQAPRALLACASITITTTAETTLFGAGGSGIFVDLSWICVTNTSATAVQVSFRPAIAGTVGLSVIAPAGQSFMIPFSDVPFLQPTANNNWTAQLSAAVTDVRITAGSLKRIA